MITRERRYKILTLVISLVLVVTGAESLLRVLELGYGSNPMVGHPVLQHAHPVNYRFRVHSPVAEFGGHMVVYGPDGLRIPDTPNSLDPPRERNVIVLGDSFTEARQVEYGSSFVGRLALAFPDIQFHNYGNASYSPVLSYLQLKTEAGQNLKQSAAVVHLLYANDSEDDISYIAKATFDSRGEILAVPGRRSEWIEFLRRFYIARLFKRAQLTVQKFVEVQDRPDDVEIPGLPPGYGIYNLYEDMGLRGVSRKYLLEIKEFLGDRKVPYALSCVPSKLMTNYKIEATGKFCQQVGDWARQQDVAYIDLTEDFYTAKAPLFFERDVHFNPAGHDVVAQAFARYLKHPLGITAVNSAN